MGSPNERDTASCIFRLTPLGPCPYSRGKIDLTAGRAGAGGGDTMAKKKKAAKKKKK
jgi:hypothetical protein